MNVLTNRVARQEPGQAAIKAKLDKITKAEDQLQFLRENVHLAPTPGRQPKPINEGFEASTGTQIRSTEEKTLHIDAFCKGIQTNSLVAQRTLSLYAFLRFLALLGHPLKLCFSDHSENQFWPELGRRLSSGAETIGNRYQIAVRIQWTTSRPSKTVFFFVLFEIRSKMKFGFVLACLKFPRV